MNQTESENNRKEFDRNLNNMRKIRKKCERSHERIRRSAKFRENRGESGRIQKNPRGNEKNWPHSVKVGKNPKRETKIIQANTRECNRNRKNLKKSEIIRKN